MFSEDFFHSYLWLVDIEVLGKKVTDIIMFVVVAVYSPNNHLKWYIYIFSRYKLLMTKEHSFFRRKRKRQTQILGWITYLVD